MLADKIQGSSSKGKEAETLIDMFNDYKKKAHDKSRCPLCKQKLDGSEEHSRPTIESFQKKMDTKLKQLTVSCVWMCELLVDV
jgi:hypothetical protein